MNDIIFYVLGILLLMVAVGVSMALSDKFERKLKARLPQTRPYKWGFFVGCLSIAFAILPLFAVAAAVVVALVTQSPIDSEVFPFTLLILHGICGFFIIRRKRWAWIVSILFSFNPVIWIVNGVYAGRRWREFTNETNGFSAASTPKETNATPSPPILNPSSSPNEINASWRIMRSVVAWLCSGVAAIFGFWATYTSFGPGNSPDEEIEFESSLTGYINAADAANYSSLGLLNTDGSDFDPYILAGSIPVADEKGHSATADLIAAEKRLVAAFQSLSYGNQNLAKQVIKQASAIYIQKQLPVGLSSVSPTDNSVSWDNGSLAPWEEVSANEKWVITSQVLLKSAGVAAASAVAAWIAAWLLVVAVALVWWFFIDRLRDIARAVRGESL